ncbi:MAG: hypothetical protein J6B87_02810 [Clostridia bacterium]|nr:hypothetical protein [Clostridia bacterium]
MKIRIVALISMLVLIVLLCSGCSNEKSEIIQSETVVETRIESAGNYYLFRTEYVQEYFNFLENFDENQYELVDISTSMFTGGYGSGEFYIVTYKVK